MKNTFTFIAMMLATWAALAGPNDRGAEITQRFVEYHAVISAEGNEHSSVITRVAVITREGQPAPVEAHWESGYPVRCLGDGCQKSGQAISFFALTPSIALTPGLVGDSIDTKVVIGQAGLELNAISGSAAASQSLEFRVKSGESVRFVMRPLAALAERYPWIEKVVVTITPHLSL